MELKRYARFLRRNLPLIFGLGLFTGVLAGAIAANQQPTYRTSSSLLLALQDTRTLTTYDYDQFYVLNAQELYSANIVAWLNSPDVATTIENEAKSPEGSVRGRKSGGTIDLTGSAPTKEQSNALVASATRLITDRAKTLAQGANRASFDVVPGTAVTKTVPASPLKSLLLGLLAGLLVGIALSLLREALRRSVRGVDDVDEGFGGWTKVSKHVAHDGSGLDGYRELREELHVERGVVVVCDVTRQPGIAAANLARVFADGGTAVTLLQIHGAEDVVPLGHHAGVTAVDIKETNVSAAKAKALLGKRKTPVTIVSVGPNRADILAWQHQASSTVVAAEQDKTLLSELAFLKRELPTGAIRVALLA